MPRGGALGTLEDEFDTRSIVIRSSGRSGVREGCLITRSTLCGVVRSRAASELARLNQGEFPGVGVGSETLLIDGRETGGEQGRIKNKGGAVVEGDDS